MKRLFDASLFTDNVREHKNYLEIFLERQDKPLGSREERSAEVLDNIELPGWVHEILLMGPKHPITDKFIKTNPPKKANEIMRNYIWLLAVVFYKTVSFCLSMRKTFETKLNPC